VYRKDFIHRYPDANILHDVTIIPNTNAPKSLVMNPKRYNTILIMYKGDNITGTSLMDEPVTPLNPSSNTYLYNSDKKVEYTITGKSGRFEKCNKLAIDFDTSGRKYGKKNGRRIVFE